MIQFKEEKERVIIQFKEVTLFEFNKKNSLKVGIGQDEYTMKRGAFRFKEKVTPIYYNYYSYDQVTATMVFKYQNHAVSMRFGEQNNQLLNISFTYTDKRINRIYLVMKSDKEEFPYGCGEQFAAFNLKHKKVKIWVSEHVSLSSLLKKVIAAYLHTTVKLMPFEKYASYMVQPTFITNKKRFVHLECRSYSQFEFDDDRTIIEVREPLKSMVIGQYDSYEALMDGITNLLGKQPRLPDWVFDGMILGIQDGTEVCNQKLINMQAHDAKVSGIWAQDWEGQRITSFGKQLFWDWIYDKKLYHQLPEAIQNWHQQGVKFLGYINPFFALEGTLYRAASENGYLVKNREGHDYMVTITTFPAAMIDLTNPKACMFMKTVIKENMIGIGMRGWMADFAEYLPTDAVLYSGEDPRLVHNQWPVLWAKLNEEAIEEAKEDSQLSDVYGMAEDILFFVRAGYSHTSKHATLVWNGDQHVDWSRDFGIGSIVNSALSLSVIGMGNSHSDIGGYTTFGKMIRSKELLLRWTELGAFSMVMRSHEGNQPDKNHQFDSDEETMSFVARFTRIYKHLKPYHLHVDEENAMFGMPSIRPVFFHYESPEFLFMDQAYMLGRDLIVYPVVNKGMNKMDIQLPKDNWIHLFSGKTPHELAQNLTETSDMVHRLIIDCPVGKPIVYYRKESQFTELFEAVKGM